MKNRTTSTVVALTLAVLAPAMTPNIYADAEKKAQKARDFYQMGIVAINEGDFRLAVTSFREVLRIYPNHPQARRQLIRIQNNRNSWEIEKRKNTIRKVIIPQVDLDKVSIQEAIDVLKAQIARESKNKVRPNFIVQDPTGGFKNNAITLRLGRIPAETALRYIVDQANGHIRYDNHAIVITPRRKATPTAPRTDAPMSE